MAIWVVRALGVFVWADRALWLPGAGPPNSVAAPTAAVARWAGAGWPSAPDRPGSAEQGELAEIAQKIHRQVNAHRASVGLPPLTLHARISEQAQIHSRQMASGRVSLSHQGFQERVNALKKHLAYRRAAENVAYNMGYTDPASQAVEGWLNHPPHRKNIEGSYELTGIGVASNNKGEYYFTQIFWQR